MARNNLQRKSRYSLKRGASLCRSLLYKPTFNDRLLLSLSVRPHTKRKYDGAIQSFVEFTTAQGISALSTVKEYDSALMTYIHACYYDWSGSGNRQHCAMVKAALINRFPELKEKLVYSAQSLKGWSVQSPSESPTPMSRDVMLAVVVDLLTHNEKQAAIMILLSFDAYLRASEVINIAVGHFSDARDPSSGVSALNPRLGIATISLPRTKTGRHQFVTIRCHWVLSLLHEHIRELRHRCHQQRQSFNISTPLFSHSYSSYRKCFELSLNRLGLQNAGFTLHSLRHGAATHDFLCNVPLPTIQDRGRWVVFASLQRYINAGVSLLGHLHFSSSAKAALAAALRKLPSGVFV